MIGKNLLKITALFVLALTMSFCAPTSKKASETKAEVKELEYMNPLVKQRADPWMYKDADGTYYFIATAPEYDRIEIRKAKTINGIASAPAVEIFHKHETGVMGHHIWAPELHKIDGKWYVYFAAGEAEKVWEIRMWVLSNESADPTQGEWKEEGRIITKQSTFSLDQTVFENNGVWYTIWAQNYYGKDTGTALVMSKMKDPLTLEGPEVVLTQPDLEWERQVFPVNEGPAVLKRNGKIFLTYSASATDANYCMGMLWADANSDLMDSTSWHKLQEPVFYTNDSLKRFGPGHNSFTVAEDGKTDLLIYHARDYKELKGSALGDPNRDTRVRKLSWTEDGFPDFRQNEQD